MGFGCECGYSWKGTLPETLQHEGEYTSLIEREQWMVEAAAAIASFIDASASGLRDQWFEESKYFNSLYPRDLPVREVIHDLLTTTRMSKALEVYRCPQCRRVYIQEQLDTNQWLEYQYVETTGSS